MVLCGLGVFVAEFGLDNLIKTKGELIMSKDKTEDKFNMRAGKAGGDLIEFMIEHGQEWMADLDHGYTVSFFNAALWKALKCMNTPHIPDGTKDAKFVRGYDDFADDMLMPAFIKFTQYLNNWPESEEEMS